MADDIIANETVPDKRTAMRLARSLGCEGAHKAPDAEDGGWHPCESETALRILISKGSKGYRAWKKRQTGTKSRTVIVDRKDRPTRLRKRRRRRRYHNRDKWEKLGERGVAGIDTLPGGGLVSGKPS